MRYYISACSILIALFTVVLPFPHAALAAEKGDTLTCEQLDSLAGSPLWTDHMKYSSYLVEHPINDTCWAVESIVRFIDKEANYPSTTVRNEESYLDYSQFMVRQSVRTLGALQTNIIPALHEEKNKYTSKTQSLISTALAMLRDESVHNKIRDLMLNNPDPQVRSLAALSIGAYKDTLDIPILLIAMKDTFSVTVFIDYAGVMNQPLIQSVSPVVWDAYTSLVGAFGIIPDDTSKVGFRHIDKNK